MGNLVFLQTPQSILFEYQHQVQHCHHDALHEHAHLCWNKFPLHRNRLWQTPFYRLTAQCLYACSIWLNYVRLLGQMENHYLADGVDPKFLRNNQPPIFVQLTVQLFFLFWFQGWCRCRIRTRSKRSWKRIIGIILSFSINRPCKDIKGQTLRKQDGL